MKQYGKLLLLAIFIISSSLKKTDYVTINVVENSNLPKTPELVEKPLIVKKIQHLTYEEFSYKLAKLETGSLKNPYEVVNRYGYIGKYQFSKKTLRGLVRTGYLTATNNDINNFKKLPELQERAINALITHNIDILTRYGLKKYIGRTVGGVKITMEGMLAGAHLLGPYAVKHYVTTGGSMKSVKVGKVTVRKYDGNGTSIKTYLSKFQNV